MFWKKLSKVMRYIGLTIAIAGAFGAGLALAFGQIIPIEATQVMIAGLAVGLIALIWETGLDMLEIKRENKIAFSKIRRRMRY